MADGPVGVGDGRHRARCQPWQLPRSLGAKVGAASSCVLVGSIPLALAFAPLVRRFESQGCIRPDQLTFETDDLRGWR